MGAPVKNTDTLVYHFNYSYGEDIHIEKVQMTIDVASYKCLDSLGSYKVIEGLLHCEDTTFKFYIDESYREMIENISHYSSIIEMEQYLNNQLSGNLIDQLNEIQYLVLLTDPKVNNDSIMTNDANYTMVAIEWVKTCDPKYDRWLNAVNVFCCDNPQVPQYDCEIYERLNGFCDR